MRFFKNKIKQGNAVSTPGFADGITAMAYALENMEVVNGYVDWTVWGAPRIIVDASGSGAATADFDPASGGGGSVADFDAVDGEDGAAIVSTNLEITLTTKNTITGAAGDDVTITIPVHVFSD
jgi:hypothetical protein